VFLAKEAAKTALNGLGYNMLNKADKSFFNNQIDDAVRNIPTNEINQETILKSLQDNINNQRLFDSFDQRYIDDYIQRNKLSDFVKSQEPQYKALPSPNEQLLFPEPNKALMASHIPNVCCGFP
jgi:hypothetical protein